MRATVWMLIAMGSFELVWIGWQASQGLDFALQHQHRLLRDHVRI